MDDSTIIRLSELQERGTLKPDCEDALALIFADRYADCVTSPCGGSGYATMARAALRRHAARLRHGARRLSRSGAVSRQVFSDNAFSENCRCCRAVGAQRSTTGCDRSAVGCKAVAAGDRRRDWRCNFRLAHRPGPSVCSERLHYQARRLAELHRQGRRTRYSRHSWIGSRTATRNCNNSCSAISDIV